VLEVAAKPIKLPDHENIILAQRLEAGSKAGPIVCAPIGGKATAAQSKKAPDMWHMARAFGRAIGKSRTHRPSMRYRGRSAMLICT
jgi:hypothetical protein